MKTKNKVKQLIKISIISLALTSISANATWSNNYSNYQDNGIFGYNPYSHFDPRWYLEEAINIADEFDYKNKRNSSHDFPVKYMDTPYDYRKIYGDKHQLGY